MYIAMPIFRKKSRDLKEAEQFTKDFMELMRQITAGLRSAETAAQATPQLEMLERLASHGMPQAVTFHGLAYLMDDKPWYDPQKGFSLLKKAAESESADSSFCMYQLGLFHLLGRKDIPTDPVMGKYWIERSAALGFGPAIEELKSRWG